MFTKTLRYKGPNPKNIGRWGMIYPGAILVLTEAELSGLERDGNPKEWEGVPASARALKPKRPLQADDESDRDFKAKLDDWRTQVASYDRLEAEREPSRTFIAWAGMAGYEQLRAEVTRLRSLGAPVPERLEERGTVAIRATLSSVMRNWPGAAAAFVKEGKEEKALA